MISTKFQGLRLTYITYIATLHNPRVGFVVRGPTIVAINENLKCPVAIIIAAPCDIQLERRELLGAFKMLQQQAMMVQSIKALPIAKIIGQNLNQAVDPQALKNSILAQGPHDKHGELLALLQQYPECWTNRQSTLNRPLEIQKCQDTGTAVPETGKILQAHQPLIEDALDSWICLSLVRKDSIFNMPLFCI